MVWQISRFILDVNVKLVFKIGSLVTRANLFTIIIAIPNVLLMNELASESQFSFNLCPFNRAASVSMLDVILEIDV